MDPELRDAFGRLGADLRGEIRSSAAETRAYVDERVQSSAAETRAYVDERVQSSAAETRAYIDERVQSSAAETRAYVDDRLQTTTAETRRHFEVVGESLRSDIRGVAEGVALLSQRVDRGFAEQAGRTDGLEGRVVRLEVRVLSLEDNRKPPRPRRRR